MIDWQGLGLFSETKVPETIRQDARAFFKTLSQVEQNASEIKYSVEYREDRIGQHAVILDAPHDGERWHYALIYDEHNCRIKVLKYSTGSYMC